MEFTNVTIIETDGMDTLLFESSVPSPIYPFEGNAVFEVQVACGYGKQWLQDNFPNIDVKVLEYQGV